MKSRFIKNIKDEGILVLRFPMTRHGNEELEKFKVLYTDIPVYPNATFSPTENIAFMGQSEGYINAGRLFAPYVVSELFYLMA